jgi:putative two-component system response regulator
MSNLDQGKNILKTFYKVYPAPSAAKLFEILENVIPELILLDIEMPEMNGYEAIKILKADERYANIAVIFLTSKNDENSELKGFDLGAADYISKPFSAPLLLKRIENQLIIIRSQAALKDYAENLEIKVMEKTMQVINLQDAILSTVADLVEFRDNLTGGHIARTQLYMKALINEMIRDEIYKDEISKWDTNFFIHAVQLHDVGKIAITDLILNKPSRLTDEEFEIMKTHVTVGVDAIERIMNNTEEIEQSFLRQTLYIVGTHHEKWDGSGYPLGLKGLNIPLEGRLMAIGDVYDALISVRPYKKAFTNEDAKKIIIDGFGSHFDPTLREVFCAVTDEFSYVAKNLGMGVR